MESETFSSMIQPMAAVHRMIRTAFVGAIPVYVVVAYVGLGSASPGATPGVPGLIKITTVALSLMTAALAPYVPRLLFPDSRLRQLLDRPPDPKADISPDEQRLLALVGYLFAGFVARLGFNEAIALYGLVLAILSKTFVTVLPFAVVSFALVWKVPLPLDEALKRSASIGVEQGVMPTRPR